MAGVSTGIQSLTTRLNSFRHRTKYNPKARLSPPVDPNACHTLEILVALGFTEDHTPASPGGDSITWFYSPTGSLADCPVYDAGPVPDASDSGDDASDGAGG